MILAGLLALAGCTDGQTFADLFKKAPAGETAAPAAVEQGAATIEKDVEAPDVFGKTAEAVWDGRFSLGGVWVAHADVKEPERAIIRNLDNGKFVVGALFRRELGTPGPDFQVSSDAAEALGMEAGTPVQLKVVVLRRETVPVAPAPAETPSPEAAPTDEGVSSGAPVVEETTLDPVAQIAANAIDKATAGAPEAAKKPEPRPLPKSTLKRPYIQIGIFSVEANANRTGDMMRGAGIIPTIKRAELNGKKYWRVIVGPVTSVAERDTLMKKVRELGFTDAYAVSG